MYGKHIVTLFFPISRVVENSSNTFSMYLKISAGTVKIGETQIRATISGQGLAAGLGDWNGRININENIGYINISDSWKTRGILQWQCKNHRTNGVVTCKNSYVDNRDMESGFVKAFNEIVSDSDRYMERWEAMKKDGTPLEKIRASQIMETIKNGTIGKFVPEIAQLLIKEVTVFGAKKFEYSFLDGSKKKVSL